MEGKSSKKIGQYIVSEQLLSEGSFSKVYLAHDDQNRTVAVKVISLSSIRKQQIKALQDQITLLKECRHENVVCLLDVKKSRNNFYVFMEYCQDGSLEQFIANKITLEEKEAMIIFSQIARGLQVLKTCNIMHRDLKPANILISGKVIKIADFGLAERFTKNQMLVRQKGYPLNKISQIQNSQAYSQKMDVYNAGTVLYSMLFGTIYSSQLLKVIENSQKVQNSIKVRLSREVITMLKAMLQTQPLFRVDMNGMLDLLSIYTINQKAVKLHTYRQMSLRGLSGMGAIGSMIAALGFHPFSYPPSPKCMDLVLYGKLCCSLKISDDQH